MTKVGLYARVSSEEQAERGSIETQVAELRRWCEAQGVAAPVLFKDDGISGTLPLEDRPGGAALLEAARERKVSEVVIFKLDRLGRSTLVTLRAIEQLEALGVTIRATSEPFDSTTAAGRFAISVLASVGALERENIRERTGAGLRRKIREGGWASGRAPFGYRLVDKHLVVDEEPLAGSGMSPAEVARLMFSLIGDDGLSSRAVAQRLDTLGVPPPERGRGGWLDSTVRRVVKNPLYRGAPSWGRRTKKKKPELVEGKCSAIVTEAVWDAAQEGLRKNFTMAKRNRRRDYLLSAMIRCPACGRRYSGTTSSGMRVYVCGGRRDLGCRARQVRADVLEATIWSDIAAFLRAPGDVLEELAHRQAAAKTAPAFAARRAKALKRQLALKAQERERVIGLYRRGLIGDAEVEAQLGALRHEQDGLAAEIKDAEDAEGRAKEVEGRIEGAAGLLAELNRRLGAGPLAFETRRRIVEALVDGIEISPEAEGAQQDRAVTAHYVFALPDAHAYAPVSHAHAFESSRTLPGHG